MIAQEGQLPMNLHRCPPRGPSPWLCPSCMYRAPTLCSCTTVRCALTLSQSCRLFMRYPFPPPPSPHPCAFRGSVAARGVATSPSSSSLTTKSGYECGSDPTILPGTHHPQAYCRVVTDETPVVEQGVFWVTMLGLPGMSLALVADQEARVPLDQLALTFIRALHSAVTTTNLGLLLETGQAHGRSGHSSVPWSERVSLTYLATCTGAGCQVSHPSSPVGSPQRRHPAGGVVS